MSRCRVLFVDDEEHVRFAGAQTLELAGVTAEAFAGAEAALAHVARDTGAILVTDIRMQGMDGLELMRRALEIDPDFPVILVTGHGDIELAVQSLHAGAYDFLEKPFASERLVEAVRRALDKRRLTLENRALRWEVGRSDPIEARLTGRSDAMVQFRARLRAVAASDADILILGDTGSGKETAARALHRASPRANKPFLHINCAALPAELLGSELFGHAAGAFAGATRARYGKLEHGRGGTVFLDEIDSLPHAVQGELLQVLESRTFTPLGASDPVTLDTRFVAACRRPLDEAVAEGRFRDDLLYRIAVVTLRLPTLRDRREDIPNLFLRLVQQAAARHKRDAPEVPPAVFRILAARDWPGNVRELRNVADRFVLGLDLELSADLESPTLAEQMAAHERAILSASLMAARGDVTRAHEALGISRRTLYEKMQRHGLDRSEFRDDDETA